MKSLDELVSYILLSLIGIGIILFGVISAVFLSEFLALIAFVIGIAICICAFFLSRKK